MTARGAAVLLAAAGCMLARWLFGLAAAFLPGAALLALFLTGMASVLPAALLLRVRCAFRGTETERGASAEFLVRVALRPLLPCAPPEVTIRGLGKEPETFLLRVRPWGASVVPFSFRPPHVGRHAVVLERFTLRDCFGLFRICLRPRGAAASLLVLPASRALRAPDGRGDRPGGTAEREPDEPGGLRDFRDGDELRRIHWKVSARRGVLTVRTPEGKRDPDLLVAFAPAGPGNDADALSERCAELLSGAAFRGGRVRLLSSGTAPYDLPALRPGDLPQLRRVLAESVSLSAARSSRLSQAQRGFREPDAVALFAASLSAGEAEALLAFRRAGADVRICLPGSALRALPAPLAARLASAGIRTAAAECREDAP